MKKRFLLIVLSILLVVLMVGCGGNSQTNEEPDIPNKGDETINDSPVWNNGGITYNAKDISNLFASTPKGFAKYNENDDTATIKSVSIELDNYGGIQTDKFQLDFSYPIIFQMDVKECFTQYIVKLNISGERTPYYVLSDSGETGLISVDVKDAMLCDKYRQRRTQPDPGYDNFRYENKKVEASFYIMPKGPYDESQTATMKVKSISVFNRNEPKIKDIFIKGNGINNGQINVDKGAQPIDLNCEFNPQNISDKSVTYSSSDENVAKVVNNKLVFNNVGKCIITAVSNINMSRKGELEVKVLSKFASSNEARVNLVNGLQNNQTTQSTEFLDGFNDSWANMNENIFGKNNSFISCEIKDNTAIIYNYYQNEKTKYYLSLSDMADKVAVDENGIIKTYENIDKLNINYMKNNVKLPSYKMKVLILRNNKVTKCEIFVKAVTLIKNYSASDICSSWTDGDKATGGERLAAGSAKLEGDCAIIQEQNPVAAYGGVFSEELKVDVNKNIEIIMDIQSTSHNNNVLWDLRVIYFEHDIRKSNPRTINSGVKTGKIIMNLVPKYQNIRLFLVANGNDVSGSMLDGASISVKSLKIQYVD